jgi:hypothetical protein
MEREIEEEELKEEEQEEIEFHQIDLLRDHGMNQNDIQKLIDAGFMSVEAVFYTTKRIYVK